MDNQVNNQNEEVVSDNQDNEQQNQDQIIEKPFKLKKVDYFVVAIFSLVMMCLAAFYVFFEMSFIDMNKIGYISYYIVVGPIKILLFFLLYFISLFSSVGEGFAMGAYILLSFATPVLIFILWFWLFSKFAQVSMKIFGNQRSFFLKHIVAVVVVLFLLFINLFSFFGVSKIDTCLLGQNISGSGYDGIGVCFSRILDKVIKDSGSKEKAMDYCVDLSTEKEVKNLDISYQEFCAWELIKYHFPLDAGPRLCELFGQKTNSEINTAKCMVHFMSDLNPEFEVHKNILDDYCANFPKSIQTSQCLSD